MFADVIAFENWFAKPPQLREQDGLKITGTDSHSK